MREMVWHCAISRQILLGGIARDRVGEAEARFKKVLEGVLLGPLTDKALRPLIDGLGRREA